MILKAKTNDIINTSVSREQLLTKISEIGLSTDAFAKVSVDDLTRLLLDLEKVINDIKNVSKISAPILSKSDEKILKMLLTSTGDVSSLSLSRELNLPLSTVQRRRKRLESYLLNFSYSLKSDKLGFRTARLFISAEEQLGFSENELLALPFVTNVTKTMGDTSVNFIAEIVFKTNTELLQAIEKIRSMTSIKNVSWAEILDSKSQNQEVLLDYLLGYQHARGENKAA